MKSPLENMNLKVSKKGVFLKTFKYYNDIRQFRLSGSHVPKRTRGQKCIFSINNKT